MVNPGDLLEGRYRVIRQLGEGGFSQTYEVDDGSTLKVLKILNLDDFSDLESRQKVISLFKQEAHVLGELHHPGIPRVEPGGYFTFRPKGRLEPLHCLVMERIDGQNLEEWLKNNQPISQEQAIAWLTQLVEILERVHQQRYFHRDIKPANIMLRIDGKQLALIDFGTVRQVTATYLAKIGIRREGTQIISSGYTPPEQADGIALPQSDFFALGRTFVHLLTGKHPLDLRDVQTGELIWRNSVPQIAPPLADLLDDLMALSPGQRPQNTQIILQRLQAVDIASASRSLNGKSSTPVSPNHQGKIKQLKPETRPASSWRSATVKVGATFLLLLVGAIGFRLASPQMAIALNDRGREYYAKGEKNEAEPYFIWATRLNPKYFAAYYNWGSVCEDRGEFTCARQNYLFAMQGGFTKAYNNLGHLYITVDKDCKAAIPLLEEGLNRVKDDDELRSALVSNLGKCRS